MSMYRIMQILHTDPKEREKYEDDTIKAMTIIGGIVLIIYFIYNIIGE